MTLLFCTLTALLSAAPTSDNPCTNGSFEQLAPNGFPADWGPVGTTVEVTSDAHSGKRALRFLRTAGTDPKIETGLNRVKLLDCRRGGVEFWYKAISVQSANLRIYAIPINAEGFEKTGANRAAFTVLAGHIGDGQWHRGRFKYDFTGNPEVKSLHFAVRIEGAAGELLVDDFAYLDHVGPVLRFGTVRLEEDPKSPGSKCRVHAPVYNDGDEAARDSLAVVTAPAGLRPDPAEARLGNIAPGKMVRAAWILEGERNRCGKLELVASCGSEKATTGLVFAPDVVVRSAGPASPLAMAGKPLVLECVLANRGTAAAIGPSARFEMAGQEVVARAKQILPGESATLRGTIVPSEQSPLAEGSIEVRRSTDDRWGSQHRVFLTVGAADELLAPSNQLKAVANARHALLENERLRLAFRRNEFGFGPAELAARTPKGWQTVAVVSELSHLGIWGGVPGAPDMKTISHASVLAQEPPKATVGPDRSARLEFTVPLAKGQNPLPGVVRVSFAIRAGEKTISARHEFVADRPCNLAFFQGPMVYALGSDEAVFPGLEWLVSDERSSDTLDIAEGHADRNRTVVHPNYVAIPVVGVHGPSGTVGLLWDVHQKWDGVRDRPAMLFASPNCFNNYRGHLMALFLPSVPDFVDVNRQEATRPYPVEPGKSIRLECRIFADGTATDALAAIDEWARVYGIPQPAAIPRGSYEKEIEFSMQAYLKSLWVPEEKTWWTSKGAGPVMSPKGRPPSYAADLLVGELLSPSPEVRKQCRARAEEVARLIGSEARLDALRFPGRMDLALANPINAAGLLASRGDDGAWRFDANLQAGPPFEGMDYYELGPDKAVELGTCAQKAYQVLRYARIAGDWDAYRRMIKTLELMETFRVPRAAQVWEVPVHTPDILAAADAVDAFIEAYRFSGDERWLRDAIVWARRGLPFVYLWQDPQRPFLLGSSIPVFGASWFTCSWFGRPVQWNGLRYAGAVLKLDGLDKSYPWRQIAEMLVRSAMHQQDAAGENAALWPDNISAINSEKCPWVFAPRMIIEQVLTLLGRSEEPATVILGQGEKRLHLTATAKITDAAWDGSACSFKAAYPSGEQGVVLVSNVVRPSAVLLDGRRLDERPDVEKGAAPGWRYDMGLGILSVRVSHDGPATVRVEGAAFRHVDRLPMLAERIAFEFNQSAEGWTAANHVGPLEIRDGALCGPITGGDPYIIRSMVRVRGDDCPVVLLRMRVTAGQTGQFYWGTESAPGFAEERVVTFPLQTDGQFHEYRLEVGKHPGWAGQTITSLRIDPGNGAAVAEFGIDYVRGVTDSTTR